MIPNQYFGVSFAQVSLFPISCVQIEGLLLSATNNLYLQVFDSCVTPANNAVPIYQLPLNANAQFQETMQVSNLNLGDGLYVGISSTAGTYTPSVATMNIILWTDYPPTSANVVGVYTVGVDGLIVYADPNPTKRLYKLVTLSISATQANPNYLLLFGYSNPMNGAVPIAAFEVTSSLVVSHLSFGVAGGLAPIQQGKPYLNTALTDYTLHTGCYLFGSSTGSFLTQTVDSRWLIYAITN